MEHTHDSGEGSQNPSELFDFSKWNDVDFAMALQDIYGPGDVTTMGDLLVPSGSGLNQQNAPRVFPSSTFEESMAYYHSHAESERVGTILPVFSQNTLGNGQQLPVVGWELTAAGPTQILVCF